MINSEANSLGSLARSIPIVPKRRSSRIVVPVAAELVGQAADLQLLHRARVHGEGPGHVRLVGAPFEHGDANPGLGQVAGQHHAGGPRPDDDHIGRLRRLLSTSVELIFAVPDSSTRLGPP